MWYIEQYVHPLIATKIIWNLLKLFSLCVLHFNLYV
jgi:hypothetical protein